LITEAYLYSGHKISNIGHCTGGRIEAPKTPRSSTVFYAMPILYTYYETAIGKVRLWAVGVFSSIYVRWSDVSDVDTTGLN